jgi:hypothetical protein
MLAQTDLNLVNNPVTGSVFLVEEAVVGEPWAKRQSLGFQTDKNYPQYKILRVSC